jgi:DNA invertase Pin-like site-specific DNA recombinase
LADGVPLATLMHPDAPARGQQTRRGMRAKDRRGGRPVPGYKKRRRLLNQTKIRWLIGLGLSARAVARLLNLHPNQVARWLPK